MYKGYQVKFSNPAPKGDLGKAMERKEQSIRTFQGAKEQSIKMQSAGRDAVLLTTTFYPELTTDPDKENKIQERIKYWNSWMHDNIYDLPF